MGLSLFQNFQNLQNNLFPYQQSLDRMGRKLGVGSRMPGWARTAAMSPFQPVEVPEKKQKKKQKKKDKAQNTQKVQSGKSGKRRAKYPADEESRPKETEAGTGAAGYPEDSIAADGEDGRTRQAKSGQKVPGQLDRTQGKDGEGQGRPDTAALYSENPRPGNLRPENLRSAVAWSVILGEPAARRRRRRADRRYGN